MQELAERRGDVDDDDGVSDGGKEHAGKWIPVAFVHSIFADHISGADKDTIESTESGMSNSYFREQVDLKLPGDEYGIEGPGQAPLDELELLHQGLKPAAPTIATPLDTDVTIDRSAASSLGVATPGVTTAASGLEESAYDTVDTHGLPIVEEQTEIYKSEYDGTGYPDDEAIDLSYDATVSTAGAAQDDSVTAAETAQAAAFEAQEAAVEAKDAALLAGEAVEEKLSLLDDVEQKRRDLEVERADMEYEKAKRGFEVAQAELDAVIEAESLDGIDGIVDRAEADSQIGMLL